MPGRSVHGRSNTKPTSGDGTEGLTADILVDGRSIRDGRAEYQANLQTNCIVDKDRRPSYGGASSMFDDMDCRAFSDFLRLTHLPAHVQGGICLVYHWFFGHGTVRTVVVAI